MRLLTAHKILVAAFLVLCVVMVAWGVAHRRQAGAWMPLALGLGALPSGAWYLRRLFRHPPLK